MPSGTQRSIGIPSCSAAGIVLLLLPSMRAVPPHGAFGSKGPVFDVCCVAPQGSLGHSGTHVGATQDFPLLTSRNRSSVQSFPGERLYHRYKWEDTVEDSGGDAPPGACSGLLRSC